MNRKISTLLTAGLLVAGSLCGSAFAQTPTVSIKDLTGIGSTVANELKNGARYVMVDASSSLAYGHEISTTTGKIVEVGEAINTPIFYDDSDSKDGVKKYIWTVSVTEAPRGFFSYTLTNAETGKALRYNSAYSAIETDPAAKAEDTFKDFVFENTATVTSTPTGAEYSASNKYMVAYKAGATVWNGLSWSGSPLVSTTTISAPAFYEVKSEELGDVTELNALYNTSGFSFASKPYDTDQTEEPIGNLFNTKKVVARYVSTAIEVDVTRYPSYSGNTRDLRIEPGMYFFTENAPKDGADYKEWMNATILVVSSTETVEATNAGRASGDGFALAEVKVSDLNFYQGSDNAWMTAGNDISINNANFRVQKSYVDAYPYELNVDNFRYREQASKAKHVTKSVKLHVLKHSDKYYLTTTHATDDQFIFKLAAAGMKKGIELLNTEAKVAAYTIRILDGKEYAPSTDNIDKKDIKSVYGKYLTNAVRASQFELVAKAKVLSQLETPAYQWAISSVDNEYEVTFTNRETGEHFTASLFPKADLGENVYELSTKSEKVTAIYVDANTYNETEGEAAEMQQLIVELTPAEVDPYAGFLNLDDETLVTMAFARDNNETSNKWYVAAKKQANPLAGYELNKNGKFANEVSDAAQWQLVKDDKKRTIIERSFVYNKDGRVTVQARADKGYAYVYQLQYINDGIETEKYFPKGISSVREQEVLVAEGQAEFVIKLAADGSVYLIPVNSTSSTIASILNKYTKSVVDATYKDNIDECQYEIPSSVYAWPSASTQQDWLLNTYLIVEAPEISYPAEEGHISLVSDKGNYISMNENRDGIVVNENQYSFYLQVTDEDAVVPSFYISNKGTVENGDRLFLFNPADSVNYYVADGTYDRKYEWIKNETKAIFKPATLWETKDTLTTVVKGNKVSVAEEADDEGVLGGLDYFKVQIIQCEDNENEYRIRSVAKKGSYLYSFNDQLSWSGSKEKAMRFTITTGDPTANESIADAAEGVKVIAGNGTVEIQGAAGKNVVITNVLGKVITSTVLISDNATIAAPAGIVVVAVDGEAAVKAVVK